MNIQLLSVQRNGRAANSRPRIQFCGDWLTEMGFVNGALVQALPEPDGFVFHLCNENIHYSELFHATKEKGGTLIRVYIANTRTVKGPAFVTTGKHVCGGGLSMGDNLVAKCEYGCIRVRKVIGNVRLIHVARGKNDRTGVSMPRVFLLGNWLSDIGFTPYTLVTAASELGCITFTAHDKAVVYSEVVKFARQHKMRLIEVVTKNGIPLINVGGSIVDRADFGLDDIFAADYEYGVIKLQKFEPVRFGF